MKEGEMFPSQDGVSLDVTKGVLLVGLADSLKSPRMVGYIRPSCIDAGVMMTKRGL